MSNVIGRAERVALVQCAYGEYQKLLDLTREHHQAFADRHGITYRCFTDRLQTSRSPHWDKCVALAEVLESGLYDLVVYLDVDTVISDPQTDFREALSPEHWLGAVRFEVPAPGLVNTGMLILRAGITASEFLHVVWTSGTGENPCDDEVAVNRLFSDSPHWTSGVRYLPAEWNSTINVNAVVSPKIMAWHGWTNSHERYQAMASALAEVKLRFLERDQYHQRREPD